MPGAGKTVLASIVIHRLETLEGDSGGTICVAYVYIRYSEPLGVRDILEALVKQISERHKEIVSLAELVYFRHRRERTQPTQNDLLGVLAEFIKVGKRCFFILDGLDEMLAETRRILIELLASLDAKLFITSRPLQALQRNFPDAAFIEVSAQPSDIDLHIRESIRRSIDLQELLEEEDIKQEVTMTIQRGSAGMFLHATLQLEALRQCLSVQDMAETLEQFPASLENVYSQTWDRILRQGARHANLAKLVFLWIIHARRNLTIDELRRAVATSPESHAFDAKRMVTESSLIAACCGLVVVEEESRLARLVHYTAQDALKPLIAAFNPLPHDLIASVCIQHLKTCGFQDVSSKQGKELDNTLNGLLDADPLLTYAHTSWDFHAHNSLAMRPAIDAFILGCHAYPLVLFGHDEYDLLNALHVAAYYGFPALVSSISQAQDYNVQTLRFRSSPLMLACHRSQELCVTELLALPNIDVNLSDEPGWTPLMAAAEWNLVGFGRALLRHPNTDVNATREGDLWTALLIACWHGHEGFIKLLLADELTDVNYQAKEGVTGLMLASAQGHLGAIKILLDFDETGINLVDCEGRTPLSFACEEKGVEVVTLLLTYPTIDINRARPDGFTPLALAAWHGHTEAMELVMAAPGADVNLQMMDKGWTPLMAAVENGHEETLQVLLARSDTKVNLGRFDDGWTALMIASWHGREAIIDLLLDSPSIDVNKPSLNGFTALMAAACQGHEGALRRLMLSPAIDPNAVDDDGACALKIAVDYGYIEGARVILADPRVEVDLKDKSGETPILAAMAMEDEAMVKLLRDFGEKVTIE